METIQDYPSSYTYVTTQNQNVYYIPSVVLGKQYIKVTVNNVIINPNVYDIINNSLVMYFKPLDGLVLQIKVASSVKGITQLDYETSQEAVLDAMVLMNALIKDIDIIKNVRNNLPHINSVKDNLPNILLVYSKLHSIKDISDNITLVSNTDIKNHNSAINSDTKDSHTMESITGLLDVINSIQLAGVFPTIKQDDGNPNDFVLAREGGEVKQLKVDVLRNRQLKIANIVNPYVLNNGILNGIDGVYENNINTSSKVLHRSKAPLPTTRYGDYELVKRLISLFDKDDIHFVINDNIDFVDNANVAMSGIAGTSYDNTSYRIWDIVRGFILRVYSYSGRTRTVIYERKLEVVNNTGVDLDTIINEDVYPRHHSKISTGNKTFRRFTSSDQRILVIELKYNIQKNKPYIELSLLNYTLPHSGDIHIFNSNLVISENTFYLVREDGSFIYNANTQQKYSIRSSIQYNGNTYSRSTRIHNTVDSYNYKYIPYYNGSLNEIIFVNYLDIINTDIVTTPFYIENTLLPFIRGSDNSIPFGNISLIDFDLKHKRFLIGRSGGNFIYKDDVHMFTTIFPVNSILNVWLLPRNKLGYIYIQGVEKDNHNISTLTRNNVIVNKIQNGVTYYPHIYSKRTVVASTEYASLQLALRASNVKEEDYHLVAGNYHYAFY